MIPYTNHDNQPTPCRLLWLTVHEKDIVRGEFVYFVCLFVLLNSGNLAESSVSGGYVWGLVYRILDGQNT